MSKITLFWLSMLASLSSALAAYLVIIYFSLQCYQNTVICKIFEPWFPFVMFLAWTWLPIICMRKLAMSVVKKFWIILWSLIVTGTAIIFGAIHSYVLFN
jgi:hypothetical protein